MISFKNFSCVNIYIRKTFLTEDKILSKILHIRKIDMQPSLNFTVTL